MAINEYDNVPAGRFRGLRVRVSTLSNGVMQRYFSFAGCRTQKAKAAVRAEARQWEREVIATYGQLTRKDNRGLHNRLGIPGVVIVVEEIESGWSPYFCIAGSDEEGKVKSVRRSWSRYGAKGAFRLVIREGKRLRGWSKDEEGLAWSRMPTEGQAIEIVEEMIGRASTADEKALWRSGDLSA